jgi:hypothetical protein
MYWYYEFCALLSASPMLLAMPTAVVEAVKMPPAITWSFPASAFAAWLGQALRSVIHHHG